MVALGCFTWACETEDCVSVANNDLLITFYESDSSTLKDVFFDYVTAEGSDSIFFSRSNPTSSYAFPVNPAADETVFYIQIIDSVRIDTIALDPIEIDTVYVLRDQIDTLGVEYVRRQRIITQDCGVEISYANIAVRNNSFSGDEVVNASLSRFNNVNIKVFY
jgi:hypothetical protein